MSGGRPKPIVSQEARVNVSLSIPVGFREQWDVAVAFCKKHDISVSKKIREGFFAWYELAKNKPEYKDKKEEQEQDLEEKND